MRVALISDLHANEVALSAVFRHIQRHGVDETICLGDVATLGPHPREVLDILKLHSCPCIMGNHDEFLLDAQLIYSYTEAPIIQQAVDWCREQLRPADFAFLRSFQTGLERSLDARTQLSLFHGSPRSHMENLLATTPPEELDALLGEVDDGWKVLTGALAMGWMHYREVSSQHEVARRDTREQWLHQGSKNPHSAAHYGVYAFKPRIPLSLVDPGVDPYVGVAAWLEAHKQNEFKFKPAQDAMLNLFGKKTTAVMTNVPGPREKLKFLGSTLEQSMFWVPQSGDIGLGVSILSYGGGVQFGVITDTAMCPDPQKIIDEFEPEFAKLSLVTLMLPWEA